MSSDQDLENAAPQLVDHSDALADILKKYGKLIEEHQWLKRDFQNKCAVRDRQSDALTAIFKQHAQLLEENKRLKNALVRGKDTDQAQKQTDEILGTAFRPKNFFVLVLIHGSIFPFDETLQALPNGGSEAAHRLHDAVKATLERKGLADCKVVVRIYASIADLSSTMAQQGLVSNKLSSFSKFMASFNQKYGLADFVDVVKTKQIAEFKMRAQLELYWEMAQCKHIYLAGNRDLGHLMLLMQSAQGAEKLTLLSNTQMLVAIDSAEVFPGVFRMGISEDMYGASAARSIFSSTKSFRSSVTGNPELEQPSRPPPYTSAPTRPRCKFFSAGRCWFKESCNKSHAISAGDADLSAGDSTSPTINDMDELHSQSCIQACHVAVNKNGHRLDHRARVPAVHLQLGASLRAHQSKQTV